MLALTKQKDYKPNCKMLNNTNVRVKKKVQMSLKKDKLVNLRKFYFIELFKRCMFTDQKKKLPFPCYTAPRFVARTSLFRSFNKP